MGLPKKIKKTLNLIPEKTGMDRRIELLDDINRDGTYLPKSLLHEDLDRGFLDFVKNDLKLSVEGKSIPVVDILITTQNWAQFTQTWDIKNIDKNVSVPFITTVRTPEVKFGTIPSLRYNIPNRKQYYYAMVPNWSGERKGVDVYTIPQPVPVDIKYSVKIICNRMRELNKFNKIILEKFASRQAYTQIKGHYIPIQMDEISDESVLDLEKRKYYMQSYDFTLMGFLIDEEEFEIKPGISRAFQIFETNTSSKRRKLNKFPKNSDQIDLVFNYPVGTTTYSYEFEYTTNVKLINSNNITSYQIYINNLYYGNDISQLTTGQIQINSGDTLRIDIVKNNSSYESTMSFESTIL
jgi:hypothetical protein